MARFPRRAHRLVALAQVGAAVAVRVFLHARIKAYFEAVASAVCGTRGDRQVMRSIEHDLVRDDYVRAVVRRSHACVIRGAYQPHTAIRIVRAGVAVFRAGQWRRRGYGACRRLAALAVVRAGVSCGYAVGLACANTAVLRAILPCWASVWGRSTITLLRILNFSIAANHMNTVLRAAVWLAV